MSRLSRSWFLATLAIVVGASAARAQQEPPKPGPEHAMLKELDGKWEAVISAPDGTKSKGTMVYRSTCGGMWIASEFQAELGGAPFEGRGLDGYDAKKKKFVSVWVDSMESSPMNLEGTYDERTKTLTMSAKDKGPNGEQFVMKTVYTDKNHHTFELQTVAEGKATTMIKIEYTRK